MADPEVTSNMKAEGVDGDDQSRNNQGPSFEEVQRAEGRCTTRSEEQDPTVDRCLEQLSRDNAPVNP